MWAWGSVEPSNFEDELAGICSISVFGEKLLVSGIRFIQTQCSREHGHGLDPPA